MTLTSTAFAWREFDVTSHVRSEQQAGRRFVSFALHCPASIPSSASTSIRAKRRRTVPSSSSAPDVEAVPVCQSRPSRRHGARESTRSGGRLSSKNAHRAALRHGGGARLRPIFREDTRPGWPPISSPSSARSSSSSLACASFATSRAPTPAGPRSSSGSKRRRLTSRARSSRTSRRCRRFSSRGTRTGPTRSTTCRACSVISSSSRVIAASPTMPRSWPGSAAFTAGASPWSATRRGAARRKTSRATSGCRTPRAIARRSGSTSSPIASGFPCSRSSTRPARFPASAPRSAVRAKPSPRPSK